MKFLQVQLSLDNSAKGIKVYTSKKCNLPPLFSYCNSFIYGFGTPKIEVDKLNGCSCTGECSPGTCSCAKKASFAYHVSGGRLREYEKGEPIRECNSACGCTLNCPNRVVQQGRKYPLELFQTENRGWGIRTLDKIPSWVFIAEYVGEVIPELEAEFRGRFYDDKGQTYLFDMDGDVDHSLENLQSQFAIDAVYHGNITRVLYSQI